MAKVIGRKKVYKNQYKADCPYCGAIIIFDEDEVRDAMQYNEYAFSTGVCPICQKNVSFNKHRTKINAEGFRECGDFCNHFKNGECTYEGTDWRECPLS